MLKYRKLSLLQNIYIFPNSKYYYFLFINFVRKNDIIINDTI